MHVIFLGVHPDAELVNTMLDDAITTLKENEHPIVHTEQTYPLKQCCHIIQKEPNRLVLHSNFNHLKCRRFFNRVCNRFLLVFE